MSGNKSSQPNSIHPRVLKDSTTKVLKVCAISGRGEHGFVKSFLTNLLAFSKGINENLDKRMLDISCRESFIARSGLERFSVA